MRRHRPGEFATLLEATRVGHRVLFGIDHQWSWPRDLWAAAGLAGRPWREALRSLVEGASDRPPLGPAHVFPAAFNAWAGKAIFHCRVRSVARAYGVPARSGWTGDPVRLAERAMPGAKPAIRLGGTGAVTGASAGRPTSGRPTTPTPGGPACGRRGPTSLGRWTSRRRRPPCGRRPGSRDGSSAPRP